MDKHLLDLLSVTAVLIIAGLFTIKTCIKTRNNKCATICNGCSTNKCSKKSFTINATSSTKIIPLHTIKNTTNKV